MTRKRVRLSLVGSVIISALCLGSSIMAQTRKNVPAKWKIQEQWITYSAPGGGFSIGVPESLEHERTSTTEKKQVSIGFDELSLSNCVQSIDYYYLRSGFVGDKDRLVIREVDVSPCKDNWKKLEKVEDLFLAHIAGNPVDFHSDRPVNFNGLYGRKILYKSGFFYSGAQDSPIYNEILLGNTGRRLYIATYYRREGTVGESASIFQSFLPNLCP